jgi:radical SAM protein with 4Fe4S-binding SPASM domain
MAMRSTVARSAVAVMVDQDLFSSEYPIALQVEFTSHCQLRCRMCPLTTGTSSSSGAPGPMHDLVFDEVLRVARRCRSVILAGYGEPLTNPQCLPMLRRLDAEGIGVAIATNGLALSSAVARELVALQHLSLINVSIDSPDPKTYSDVRGGNVRRALQGLRNLMAVIDDPNRVVVSSVAMESNLASLVAFPALLEELGVKRFGLQAVMDYTEYAFGHRLRDHPELEATLHEIEIACAAHDIELELSVPDRTRDDFDDPARSGTRFYGSDKWDDRFTRQCNVPWDIPFIDKDGRVFACCFAGSAGERQLGQIGPDSFDDIWTGVNFRQFRRDIVDGATTPDICRRCSIAPIGIHLFKTWAAVIVGEDVELRDDSTAIVSLSVLNAGEQTWTREHQIRVATSAPRDSTTTPLTHPAWLSPNRPATMREELVPPGERATFAFPVVVARAAAHSGAFELVADDICWLPNTRFTVTVHGPPRKPHLERVARVLRPVVPRRVRVRCARYR